MKLSRVLKVRIVVTLFLSYLFLPTLKIHAYELKKMDLMLPISYSDGCHLPRIEFNPKPCFYGNKDSESTVYLIGDSHAAQWLPGLLAMAEEKNWRIRALTKSSCPAAFMPMYDACNKWNNRIIDEVKSGKPQLILVSNVTNNMHAIEKNPNNYYVFYKNGFRKMISELTRISQVVIIEDTPYPNFDIVKCLRDNLKLDCNFGYKRNSLTALSKLIARQSKSGWIDTSTLFCNKSVCFDSLEGINLYRDQSHISGYASVKFNFIFEPYLKRANQ